MKTEEKILNAIDYFLPGKDARSNYLREKAWQHFTVRLPRWQDDFDGLSPEALNLLVLGSIDAVA